MSSRTCPVSISPLSATQLNAQGRYREALTEAERALQQDASDCEAQFALAFACLLLNRAEEARSALDTLLALSPDYPNAAWMQAGLLRSLHGDHDPRVLPAYDDALRVDAGNLYALCERADVLRSLGRYHEAQALYARLSTPAGCAEEALRIEATFHYGCVALVLNEPQEARTAFETVLAAAPDYPDAGEMLALLGAE